MLKLNRYHFFLIFLVAVAGSIALLIGCGGGGTTPSPDTTTTSSGGTTTTSTSTTTTLPRTASPIIMPDAGSYESNSLLVTIEAPAADAIYFTTDGSTPDANPANLYTTPFTIDVSTRVRAMAVESGHSNSIIPNTWYDLYWWQPLGNGVAGSVTNVHALAVDNDGNLYVGGLFENAGGVSAKNVAKWNGSTWSSLSAGLNLGPEALNYSGGNLYAGGIFDVPSTTLGVERCYCIAGWDGTTWSFPGNGFDLAVYALAYNSGNGKLYAGGDLTAFHSGASPSFNHIAMWDGSSWSPLGGGLTGGDGTVKALAVGGSGNLYAGGDFISAEGIPVNKIAMWNGTDWSSLTSGISNEVDKSVWALAYSNGILYVGGIFDQAGGIPAQCIARWDGDTWSSLDSDITFVNVDALAVDSSGNLYVGGYFVNASGTISDIAKWNIASHAWSSLGGGVDIISGGHVQALAVDASGNLYAGGFFTKIGGVTCNYIAKWGKKK